MITEIPVNGKTISLIEDCLECENGKVKKFEENNLGHFIKGFYVDVPCPHCSNNNLPTGKVWKYWTPEAWERETGEKLNDDCAVWVFQKIKFGDAFIYRWDLQPYKQAICPYMDYAESKGVVLDINWLSNIRIAFPTQPKPDKEYRP